MSTDRKSPSRIKFTRSLTQGVRALGKHLWIWPLLGAVLIALVGFWVRSQLEEAMKVQLATQLQTVLRANVAALRLWFSEQESDAKSFAADPRVSDAIEQLAAMARQPGMSPATLAASPQAQTLERHLTPALKAQGYIDYLVVGRDKRLIASPYRWAVGRSAPPTYDLFLTNALAGNLAVSRPIAHEMSPSQRAEGPTMFVAAPVVSTNGEVVAVLGLRMQPEKEFSKIFSVAQMGETGEAYAFDRSGLMLTASRFDKELKQLGLIPDAPEASAILNLRLFDPGDNPESRAFAERFRFRPPGRPPLPKSQSRPPGKIRLRPVEREKGRPPLTLMAAEAVEGRSGTDVQGYRDYRGVKVIGAWEWLPEYEMGLAAEVAIDEALRPLYALRRTFLVLFLMLVFSGGAAFIFMVFIERLQAAARRSELAARRLGQYVLVQEIGRGANGIVYRARHSLLRRPVAVKLLSPDITNEITAARFEHEVQMTSQLTHPNTISIYDYGRTPEGMFYYAMEFLSGIDLHRLVKDFGPQPEGRVIHILRQICGSLAEAHGVGLIHRDVKPGNIILTRRGGVCDLVKVLDFGLVKAVHLSPADGTAANAVVGTPRYMAPEAIEAPDGVDGRSDLYGVGAVGYWLLTGKPLFDTDNLDELLSHQLNSHALRPSERLGKPISADLEEILVRCLAKKPEQRPPTAKNLDDLLARCRSAASWTAIDAERWWEANIGAVEVTPLTAMPEKTLVIAPRT